MGALCSTQSDVYVEHGSAIAQDVVLSIIDTANTTVGNALRTKGETAPVFDRDTPTSRSGMKKSPPGFGLRTGASAGWARERSGLFRVLHSVGQATIGTRTKGSENRR